MHKELAKKEKEEQKVAKALQKEAEKEEKAEQKAIRKAEIELKIREHKVEIIIAIGVVVVIALAIFIAFIRFKMKKMEIEAEERKRIAEERRMIALEKEREKEVEEKRRIEQKRIKQIAEIVYENGGFENFDNFKDSLSEVEIQKLYSDKGYKQEIEENLKLLKERERKRLAEAVERRRIALEKEREKEREKIAIYIKAGGLENIDKAVNFLNRYENSLEQFENEIKSIQKRYNKEKRESAFGHSGREKRLLEEENTVRLQKGEYIKKNKTKFENCRNIIELFPKGELLKLYHDNYRQKIQEEIKRLEDEERSRSIKAEQDRIDNLNKQKNEMINAQKEQSEARNKAIKENQNRESVARAIKELDDFIPRLQSHVFENKKMDFDMLHSCEQYLDKIEDLKDFIEKSDLNNIERCKKKLLSLFNKCENKNDLETDIEIINESFDKILGE